MHTPIATGRSIDRQAGVASELIKSCVHCGFCLPVCPTYHLLGDELDSPRGRIYLIKQMAEGHQPSEITREHLDKCLTCRSCETACPSGVRYGELVDVGREMLEHTAPRPAARRLFRFAMGFILSRTALFNAALRIARLVRPKLPRPLKADSWPAASHARRMVVLEGCVQPTLAPAINVAAARLLERIGVTVIRSASPVCCGALNHHLGCLKPALAQARRNIDQWIESLDSGAECILITASGCGTMIKDYGRLFRDVPAYAGKAARVSAAARDMCEVVAPSDLVAAGILVGGGKRVAWQSPCSLQHGQKIRGRVEPLLRAAGFEVVEPVDATRCCGSAGTYSILQPALSNQLRDLKVASLNACAAQVIATANIGCLQHLSGASPVPVRHWVELLIAGAA